MSESNESLKCEHSNSLVLFPLGDAWFKEWRLVPSNVKLSYANELEFDGPDHFSFIYKISQIKMVVHVMNVKEVWQAQHFQLPDQSVEQKKMSYDNISLHNNSYFRGQTICDIPEKGMLRRLI